MRLLIPYMVYPRFCYYYIINTEIDYKTYTYYYYLEWQDAKIFRAREGAIKTFLSKYSID